MYSKKSNRKHTFKYEVKNWVKFLSESQSTAFNFFKQDLVYQQVLKCDLIDLILINCYSHWTKSIVMIQIYYPTNYLLTKN